MEESLEEIESELERIADALEKLSRCCDDWDKTLCIKGNVGTYESE